MKSVILKSAVLAITACIVTIGVYEVIWNVPVNGCGMTWMYEYPKYLKVPLSKSIEKRFPKYSLFIYGEGEYAHYLQSMNGNYNLDGIPVIFVHGNAGRYKQVRSSASVSLRKSESRKYHFNYFSVDFEEELSAMYGPYLFRQTRYLYHAVNRVLKCYDHLKSNKPESVIAIGHSMGGLVIRGLFSMAPDLYDKINMIVTLASPHLSPPLLLDESISAFYHDVNQYWFRESNNALQNVTLLSLGGGWRDYLVRSDFCHLDGMSNNSLHMSTLTSTIPSIRLTTDHQCIVWCNELVRAVTRVFFNLVDAQTAQIITNRASRLNSFSKIFFSDDKTFEQNSTKSVGCESLPIDDTITFFKVKSSKCFRLELNTTISQTEVMLWVRTNLDYWIFSSPDNEIYKSLHSTTVSTENGQWKFISLRPHSKIILKLKRNDKVFAQISSSMYTHIETPSFLPATFKELFKPTFYKNIKLKSFTESWQVFKVMFNVNSKDDLIVQFYIPWSNESELFYVNKDNNAFKLRLFTGKPFRQVYDYPQLRIWNKSLSNLSFSIIPIHSASIGQFMRFHIELLIRYSLMFSIIRVIMAPSLSNTSLKLLVFQRSSFSVSVAVLLAKIILLSFGNINHIDLLIRKIIIPEVFLLLFATLISDATLIALEIILKLLNGLLYPLSFIISKMSKFMETSSLLSKIPSILLCSVVYQFQTPIGIILGALLSLDIIMLNVNKTSKGKTFARNVLLTLLPTCLVFCTIPIVIFLKNIQEGFPQETHHFRNLTTMTFLYCAYLLGQSWLTNIRSLVIDRSNKLATLLRIMVFVLAFLGYFKEFFIFYQLTYITSMFLVFAIVFENKS